MDIETLFKRTSYHFDLPEELIAHEPLTRRDEARLLVVHRKTHRIKHRFVKELPEIINSNYEVVANNTEVFRARLLGKRLHTDGNLGGRIEFFLLKPTADDRLSWLGLMKASASIQPGFQFKIGELTGVVTERLESEHQGNLYIARFNFDPSKSNEGEVPLPPYIVARRKSLGLENASSNELETYNTVYAQKVGSVAAPTAGRHFTKELIKKLEEIGVRWNEITLHVGVGTFKPVETDDIRNHKMHPESFWIDPEVTKALERARLNGKKILAVGTTTTRALEGSTGNLNARNEVNLFIHPGSGHKWKIVDAMLTNFHLPESTLLMMIADFIGSLEWTLDIYQEAVRQKYRFFSYGDAMLILE